MKKIIITLYFLLITIFSFGQGFNNSNNNLMNQQRMHAQFSMQQQQIRMQQDQMRMLMHMQNHQATTESFLLKEEKKIEKTNNKNKENDANISN